MEVRYLNDSDYDETLVSWWKAWRWTAPSKEMLPQDGMGGIMVKDGDVDVCAGFIYFTNSKTAWLEYVVSNPEYKDREKRKEALELLINVLSLFAKDKGYKYIYTSLKNKPLMERYESCGFIYGSNNCQEMVKVLD